ncbi:hypothetical protein SOVF_037160 [Spinacia oleracea]|nr:hypothetical protein SOVF_037160 [Spinacia oleracea]
MSFQDNEKSGRSHGVVTGIFQSKTALSTFQRLVNAIGTAKDTPDLRQNMFVSSLCLTF